jgi:quercetin dioxygenase-like cupin family protein
MKILAGNCRLYDPGEGEIAVQGSWTARSVVSRASGAKQITQTVHEYAVGTAPAMVNPVAEQALYVVSGGGSCCIDGEVYPIRPGSAVFVAPGEVYCVSAATPMRIVDSCCPEDDGRRVTDMPARNDRRKRLSHVHEDEREQIRAGENRVFRYLVHTDLGCMNLTQFVGWIPQSKAPYHTHQYEECIYILAGRGILHLGKKCAPSEFGPGSTIYLPDGVPHCLENQHEEPIRLLGAFYPSGSPGAAYE